MCTTRSSRSDPVTVPYSTGELPRESHPSALIIPTRARQDGGMPDVHVLPGHPFPLGAHPEAGGVRFAVASSVAEAVELCLVGEDGSERRIELTEHTFGIWHGLVPGVTPGQRYGYRVHGPYEPARGLRCNPAKLLLDPYARRITGTFGDLEATLGYVGDPMTGQPSTTDSLGHVPLSVVTSPGGVDTGTKPETPFEETVIYELHVRGFTKLHPDVPRAPARHLPGARAPGGDRLPGAARRDRGRAAAGAHVRRRAVAAQAWRAQLLGLLDARLPRPARGVRERAGPGGRRVPHDGRRAARRRHRGDPRRGVQPHVRGRGGRADAVTARVSTRRRTTCTTATGPLWTSRAAATR